MSRLVGILDVGNTRIKGAILRRGPAENLGADAESPCPLPQVQLQQVAVSEVSSLQLELFRPLFEVPGIPWFVGSVSTTAEAKLRAWIDSLSPLPLLRRLTYQDLPVTVATKFPEKTGIDRVACAAAANRLRQPDQAAIVVDAGTFIKVDYVCPQGRFQGGAILPGPEIAAKGMPMFSARLPQLPPLTYGARLHESSPPPAVGHDTVAAMQSGIFWGAVGAIRQLVEVTTAQGAGPPPCLLATGGTAPVVLPFLSSEFRYYPYLTLQGMALAAEVLSYESRPGS